MAGSSSSGPELATAPQPPPPPSPQLVSSQPTPVELINILSARVCRKATPAVNNCPVIHTADVYAEHPADLTRRKQGTVAENGEEAWYFYTQLKLKDAGGERKQRSTEDGEWRGYGKWKDVSAVSKGGVIGGYDLFAFSKKVHGKKKRTGWNLHEFRLGKFERSVVLCKVYRSPIAAPREDDEAAADLEAREALMKQREAAVKQREAAVKLREKAVKQREAMLVEAAVKQREATMLIEAALTGRHREKRKRPAMALDEQTLDLTEEQRPMVKHSKKAAVKHRETELFPEVNSDPELNTTTRQVEMLFLPLEAGLDVAAAGPAQDAPSNKDIPSPTLRLMAAQEATAAKDWVGMMDADVELMDYDISTDTEDSLTAAIMDLLPCPEDRDEVTTKDLMERLDAVIEIDSESEPDTLADIY